jgi:hypothetical protein
MIQIASATDKSLFRSLLAGKSPWFLAIRNQNGGYSLDNPPQVQNPAYFVPRNCRWMTKPGAELLEETTDLVGHSILTPRS